MATIVEALQALTARVDALSARVDAPVERAPSEADVALLRDELAARDERLASLEHAVRARAAQVDGLTTRIAALEEVVKAQRGTIASLARQLESAQAALGDVGRLEVDTAAAKRPGLVERAADRFEAERPLADAPLAIEA